MSTLSRSISSCAFVLVPDGLPPVSATSSSALRPASLLSRCLRKSATPCSIWNPPCASGPVLTVRRPILTGGASAIAGIGRTVASAAAALLARMLRLSTLGFIGYLRQRFTALLVVSARAVVHRAGGHSSLRAAESDGETSQRSAPNHGWPPSYRKYRDWEARNHVPRPHVTRTCSEPGTSPEAPQVLRPWRAGHAGRVPQIRNRAPLGSGGRADAGNRPGRKPASCHAGWRQQRNVRDMRRRRTTHAARPCSIRSNRFHRLARAPRDPENRSAHLYLRSPSHWTGSRAGSAPFAHVRARGGASKSSRYFRSAIHFEPCPGDNTGPAPCSSSRPFPPAARCRRAPPVPPRSPYRSRRPETAHLPRGVSQTSPSSRLGSERRQFGHAWGRFSLGQRQHDSQPASGLSMTALYRGAVL